MSWLGDLWREAFPPPPPVPMREAAGVTIDADEDQWRRLSGGNNRDLPGLTQDQMQKLAAQLWERTAFGDRLIELPVAFLSAEGVRVTVPDDEAQRWLDAFWHDPINAMDAKLPKRMRELALFGEQVYPAFTNELNGMVRLGYLDPALIATIVTDPDNTEQPIGVVTRRDRKGQTRRLRVIVNGDEDVFSIRTQGIRQTFTDGECFLIRVNDLSSGTRGRSDIRTVIDWVPIYDQFLFNELDRAADTRSYQWDVKLTGASGEEVQKRAAEIAAEPRGGTRVHNDAEEWNVINPELGAYDSQVMARLLLNYIIAAQTMPEHWFGGGGDVNRATAAEIGTPTMKVLTARQTVWRHALRDICTYQIRQRLKADGKPYDPADPKYRPDIVFPELATQDQTKHSTALQQVASASILLIDAGLVSEEVAVTLIAAVAGRLGVEYDPKKALEEARQEKAQRDSALSIEEPPGDPAPPGPAPVAPGQTEPGQSKDAA